MTTKEILSNINDEDQTVATAVQKVLPKVESLVEKVTEKMLNGGRLFYIGAGTSGRLGVLDASECPPTFGVSSDLVIGVIAGGDEALRDGIEDAEDDVDQGWGDLKSHKIDERDIVIGLAASGTTPYVVGALKHSRKNGIVTGCVTCTINSPLAQQADYPIEVIVGPEFLTGSTRMKSGTAQKMILNMISTTVMIRLGRVHDNQMVHMQLSNRKLLDRGTRILLEKTDISNYEQARMILEQHGSIKSALEDYNQ